jgi:glutamine synthetase
MSTGHDPGTAAAALAQQGVRAVRLLYTDLHGVARGKDIPIPHFAEPPSAPR